MGVQFSSGVSPAILAESIRSGVYNDRFLDIYMDEALVSYNSERYTRMLSRFAELFGDKESVMVFSAPGRTEVGGNHTDHQRGSVLAASLNIDAVAIAAPNDSDTINILSEGYPMITVSAKPEPIDESAFGTTKAIICGMISKMVEAGFSCGGFDAYVTSDVIGGSGLSSSAAFETLIGTAIAGLFNSGAPDQDAGESPDFAIPGISGSHLPTTVDIAKYGQYAENVYFGKPCGLMDQMACSVGSLCRINFSDPESPDVERIDYDFGKSGYVLCITDTKGSHADLTDEYAAVPEEMKAVATLFGKEFLSEIDKADFMKRIPEVRERCGDRAVLRAMHFWNESARAEAEAKALKDEDIEHFLDLVAESGNSSFKFLQNVYASKAPDTQNVSVALCMAEDYLGIGAGRRGVCRVHGGGFAGTMQAFVKEEYAGGYADLMDSIFGSGSCKVMKIRKYGGMRVF